MQRVRVVLIAVLLAAIAGCAEDATPSSASSTTLALGAPLPGESTTIVPPGGSVAPGSFSTTIGTAGAQPPPQPGVTMASAGELCEMYQNAREFFATFPTPDYQTPEQAKVWIGELGKLADSASALAPPEMKATVDSVVAIYPKLHDALAKSDYSWSRMTQENPEFLADLQAADILQKLTTILGWLDQNCS